MSPVLRFLRGLTWTRVGWVCALAAAYALNLAPEGVLDTRSRFDVPIAEYVKAFLSGLPDQLAGWLVLMLLATVTDNLPLRGVMRKLAFALALTLGVLAVPFNECVMLRWYFADDVCAGFPSSTYFSNLFRQGGGWVGLLIFAVGGAIVGIVWFSYRRDAAAGAALHAVALERSRLQRRTLDAGLKIRQARADPEFLLDSVTAIAARCEDDAGRAERMIDELVSYLRAALPDDREEASTLGRELRIVEAYLELVSLRTDGRVRRAIDVPTPLHAMQCAPAVLLPLVACLVPHRSGVTQDGIGVRIEARPTGDDLRVVIVREGRTEGGGLGPRAVAELEDRLGELYGDAASLTVDTATGVDARVVLALPRTLARAEERNSVLPQPASPPEMPFDPGYQGA